MRMFAYIVDQAQNNLEKGITLLQQKKMVIYIFHKQTTHFTTP